MCRGGGRDVAEKLLEHAARLAIDIRFRSPVRDLELGDDGIHVTVGDGHSLQARAVVLAAGGFEADPAARARYLGPGWDLAKIRGSRFNTGVVLEAALRAGAGSAGHWSAAHAVASDPGGPPFGDAEIGDVHGRYAYPYGITVNAGGRRFFDEGADQKNHTYSAVGRAIAEQPDRVAYQIFDAAAMDLLEPRYSGSSPVEADSAYDLAIRLGIDPRALIKSIDDYNAACPKDGRFDADDLDGLAARPDGQPPKSNWATPILATPLRAYRVVPAVTFAFGGLSTDVESRVTDPAGNVLPNVFACGDITGGFAAHALPAGTGMIAAGVQGLTAGRSILKLLQSAGRRDRLSG
jgi:tricarballylate dehydrogenase